MRNPCAEITLADYHDFHVKLNREQGERFVKDRVESLWGDYFESPEFKRLIKEITLLNLDLMSTNEFITKEEMEL